MLEQSWFGAMCFVIVLPSLGACASEYTLVVRNGTKETLQTAYVRFDHFSSVGGNLTPGTGTAHGGETKPLPRRVEVVWRHADGREESRPVDLGPPPPGGFKQGDLIFTILESGQVQFRFEAWAEQDRMDAEERRRNPPQFGEGELSIVQDLSGQGARTEGLIRLGHPELVAVGAMPDPVGLLDYLSAQVRKAGVRYRPGDRVEIKGKAYCLEEGEGTTMSVRACEGTAPY